MNNESVENKVERKPLELSDYARRAKNASAKKYRENHKEQLSAYAKKYRAEHLEELRAYSREYQRTHREQIRKKRIEYWERKGKEQMLMADKLSEDIKKNKNLPEEAQAFLRNEQVSIYDEIIADDSENPIEEPDTDKKE